MNKTKPNHKVFPINQIGVNDTSCKHLIVTFFGEIYVGELRTNTKFEIDLELIHIKIGQDFQIKIE